MDQSFEPARTQERAALGTPSHLDRAGVRDVAGALSILLADVFALYLKTKNFHWHMSGPRFRDYHLVLDDQAGQIFAMTDVLAERARKLGGTTIHSIGHIHRLQRLLDNDADFVTPQDMLAELREDNRQLAGAMRETRGLCEHHRDHASASVLDGYLDETERRIWFLFEMTRDAD